MRSEAAYAGALQALVNGEFEADQRRGHRVAADENERWTVRRRYSRLLAAWSPRHPIVLCIGVSDAAVAAIRSDGGAADALTAHLGRASGGSGEVDGDVLEQLRNFVVSMVCEVEAVAVVDLRRILARAPRSAPEPDGNAYEHWAHSGDIAIRTLHDAYLAVLGAASLPVGFNDGIVVFIPEAALQPGLDEHRALPKDLRPLTPGNTIMLLNRILESVASFVVHSSQRGFVRGRHLLASVLEMEGAVTGYLYVDDEAEPSAVLLDEVVACPSAEWAYIR